MTPPAVKRSGTANELAMPKQMPNQGKKVVRPSTSISSLVLALVVFGFGLFGGLVYWSSIASIQGAVVASGTFEVDGDLQVVDHYDGGVITEIMVEEGDFVAAGEPLIQLDPVRIVAQIGILNNQLANALARQGRLDAQEIRSEAITFDEELLLLVQENPSFQSILDAQSELYSSLAKNDAGEILIFAERIDQLEEQLQGIDDQKSALETQLALVREDIASQMQLKENGLILSSTVIARQEDEVLITSNVTQTDSQRQGILQQIAEVRQRSLQVERERGAVIAEEQQLVTETIYDLRQRLDATQQLLDRLTIRAPMAGQVVGLTENTIGSSIAAGEEVMRIVPAGKDFVVEAQISTADVDEVHIGGDVRVRLSAYSFRKTPPINGVLSHVSADAFFNTTTESSYYRVKVEIPETEFADLPDVHALPGMPVQVMIATEEQTVMNYLLDPILGGLETAMVEGE